MAAPRKWGYTRTNAELNISVVGCPAQVGIHRWERLEFSFLIRLPRASGDTPGCLIAGLRFLRAAPRKWGYTGE